jgi:hypothetical protein
MNNNICKVLDEAKFFEQQGFARTASQIIKLTGQVEQKEISSIGNIMVEVIKIGETFSSEFENTYPIGKEYRKKCFPQTQLIVFRGLIAIDKTQQPPPDYLIKLLNKMNTRDEYVNSLCKNLSLLLLKENRTFEESKEMFRDACTIYEQSIEGIFSSAVKILYFLMEKMNLPIPESNEVQTIWDIWHNLEKAHVEPPLFLENWPEKNSIRNAIANSQNQYDPNSDRVNFIDYDKSGKVTYESNDMSFSDFFKIWMQVSDAIDSLRYSMRLYGIFQSLAMC